MGSAAIAAGPNCVMNAAIAASVMLSMVLGLREKGGEIDAQLDY